MITIPLPIPVPTIVTDGNEVRIDRTATEAAKRERQEGRLLTFDEKTPLAICCACKEPKAHMGTFEPPMGYRWGGWFCGYCLGQGELADSLGFVIDQVTVEIVRKVAFDRLGAETLVDIVTQA